MGGLMSGDVHVRFREHPRGSFLQLTQLMCVAVNGLMALPPGSTPFFALFFDFLLAFTEDIQPGGINHQIRDFTLGGRFDTDRVCPPADAAVIRAAQRNDRERKNRINKTLHGPQSQPEYTLNHQNSGDGEARITLRSSP